MAGSPVRLAAARTFRAVARSRAGALRPAVAAAGRPRRPGHAGATLAAAASGEVRREKAAERDCGG